MKLVFTSGKSINIDATRESLSNDKKYTILIITSKNPGVTFTELIKLINTEKLSSFKTMKDDGSVGEIFTDYTVVIDVVKNTTDFSSGIDIRLAPTGTVL
jgi:hypothetical protein